MTTTARLWPLLAPLTLLFACDTESPRLPAGLSASSFANSEGSVPVNLGAPINTAATENNLTLSPDELSLYFTSNRAGGVGGNDIWVSHRVCVDCPWETPVNLGPPVNSADAMGHPDVV